LALLGIGVPLAFGSIELGLMLCLAAFVTGGMTIRQWASRPSPDPASPPPAASLDIRDRAAGGEDPSPTLLKATGTNDGHFPRVEFAMDSLGHTAKRTTTDSGLTVFTDHVLRPGQHVTFELEASDPNGDDLELSVITPARSEADVVISDGVVTWNVRDEDIADPANVHIYVASQRGYHRNDTWDDAVSFVYRVLPRA
jgi:hypothetical protein